jgi:hypothetical protein
MDTACMYLTPVTLAGLPFPYQEERHGRGGVGDSETRRTRGTGGVSEARPLDQQALGYPDNSIGK